MTDKESLRRRVDILTRLSRGGRVVSVTRDLLQLGLSERQAFVLADKISPPGPLTITEYQNAIRVVNLHLGMFDLLGTIEVPQKGCSRDEIIWQASSLIAGGEEVFAVKAQMNAELISNGFGELRLPRGLDREFWRSQESAEDMFGYLKGLEQIEIPEGAL